MDKLLHRKQAVIFDLDGTLVDSMWMWKAIDMEYLGRFGYGCPEDLQKSIEGMSFTETAVYFKKRFMLEDPIEQIKKDWTDMSIDKYRHEVPLKPGGKAFLEYAASLNLPMGIATSNSREIVDVVLNALGIGHFFCNITTSCEVSRGKPAPDVYLFACEQIGESPSDCIAVEDSPNGIKSAYAAGCKPVMVPDLTQPDEEIRPILYAVVDTLADIKELL